MTGGAVRTVTKQNGNNQNGYTKLPVDQNGYTYKIVHGTLVKMVTGRYHNGNTS